MKIDTQLYPFQGHHFEWRGHRMHYLDEGHGETVVMVHGNPTWSFYYRDLVLTLRDQYRCIVPDHIGMGLSDKPDDDAYDYTLSQRVDDLEALLDSLDISERITLVVHDWGGMIGMAWAARHPEKVARLVIMNTAAFPLPKAKRFPWQLWLTRTPLGSLLVRRFNAFSAIASRVCVTRRQLSPAVRDAYTAPYDTYDNRIATLRFVQDIPLRGDDPGFQTLVETERQLSRFTHLPILLIWGAKDFVFDDAFLDEWRIRFPDAKVERFADCGHYILEDAKEEVLPMIRQFITSHPLPAEA